MSWMAVSNMKVTNVSEIVGAIERNITLGYTDGSMCISSIDILVLMDSCTDITHLRLLVEHWPLY